MCNLRLYEARGLLEPARTEGGTRRYSANDLDRLRRISDLLKAGLNLAGIGVVLDLEAQNTNYERKGGPEVAEDRIDEQIPEADLLDQRTPLVPPSPADTLIDSGPASGISDFPGGEVDEADRLEQLTPVPGEDEDDYPRGPSGTGWS